jgi:hypothetical protein
VREDPKSGAFIEGLSKRPVATLAEITQLLSFGTRNRQTAAHALNEFSSRSHAVFTLYLQLRDRNCADTVWLSKVSLIDLAGSERAKATGCTGDRLREASYINKSLSALAKVIQMLGQQQQQQQLERQRQQIAEGAPSGRRAGELAADGAAVADTGSAAGSAGSAVTGAAGGGSRRPALEPAGASGGQIHVPYRNSVLTWLLRDCIGGNSRTVMVGTVSPADCNYSETATTLRYLESCKAVQTGAAKTLKANATVLALYEDIGRLQEQLQQAPLRYQCALNEMRARAEASEAEKAGRDAAYAAATQRVARLQEEKQKGAAKAQRMQAAVAEAREETERQAAAHGEAMAAAGRRLKAEAAAAEEERQQVEAVQTAGESALEKARAEREGLAVANKAARCEMSEMGETIRRQEEAQAQLEARLEAETERGVAAKAEAAAKAVEAVAEAKADSRRQEAAAEEQRRKQAAASQEEWDAKIAALERQIEVLLRQQGEAAEAAARLRQEAEGAWAAAA